ncbi:shugoshin 2 [Anomaloglossus baeobatrachus]|uniref:shugoshin 2 n=1 Tax=Anomaloglossus baeobatrachus TaxID=238106 RepID=UPI003F4F691A
MDVTSSSSISTLQSVKERVREKLNGSLKAVKLQTSFAAKIKTKTLNNSSLLKVSLKNKNKALASALTAEKEKSRSLGNDKMFLQKEVNVLQFQNALLRQNLSIVNKMLKDIDAFMNINLSAAIKTSSTIESSDRLSLSNTRSERFSQQSALSVDETQDFRLTGVPLRVPANTVGLQKYDSHPSIAVEEENYRLPPPPPIATVISEDCDQLDDGEEHPLNRSPKEPLSLCIEDRRRQSLSTEKVSDPILPLDEVSFPRNRNALSGGFVTRRRKRSTVSHSFRLSKNESIRGSLGTSRDSCPSTQWEINTVILPPELGERDFGAERPILAVPFVSRTSHCSLLSEKLESPQNSDVDKCLNQALLKEQPIQSENQLEVVPIEESDLQTSYPGQEKTVYEADMEMTTSESASIIAVLPKKKTQASKNKSCLPVKKTLRRVRSVREKTKKHLSPVDQEDIDLSSSNEKGNTAKSNENSASAGRYNPLRCVLSGPGVERFYSLDADPARSECPAAPVLGSRTQIIPDDQVLDGEKSELTLTLKENCTESGVNADMAPKKTKSKNIKEASKTKRSSKKEKNKKLMKQEQTDENVTRANEQIDSGKKINTLLSNNVKNLEPKLRRETYVVSAPKDHPSAADIMAKIHELNYMRETYLIAEPSPLVTVTLNSSAVIGGNDILVELPPSVDASAPKDVPHKMKNPSETKKSDCEVEQSNPISDTEALHDHKKRPVSRCSGKKTTSGLFSEPDKRKTYILSSKQNDLTGKAPLVRESFMNRTSGQSGKAGKVADMVYKNDSLMLDMVSESILDNTMCNSFAEFPSATDPESNLSIDMSKSIPAPELPVPEECNKEPLPVPNNNSVQDENDNGHQNDTNKTEMEMNQQCMGQDIKPFQDLTNKSRGSTKQSCSEESQGHVRRIRNPVNYKEPSLSKKLRRDNSFIDTTLLPPPPVRKKGKQAGTRDKVMHEESGTGDA